MCIVHVVLEPLLPVVLEVTVKTSKNLSVVDAQNVPLEVRVVCEFEGALRALVQVLLLLEIMIGQMFAETLFVPHGELLVTLAAHQSQPTEVTEGLLELGVSEHLLP